MTTQCRLCGSVDLRPVLDLGRMPLANALVDKDNLTAEEARFPLVFAYCNGCTLAQITESVDPQRLFHNYPYASSFADTAVRGAQALVERIVESRGLGPASLVVEIASNDGYLLQFYKNAGIPEMGIEPAANLAELAKARGIRTLVEFFNVDLARRMVSEMGPADVVHANNVLAHVPDLNGMIAGIGTILKPEGIAIIEVPHVKELVDKVEFDTIYHEHLSYFSLATLVELAHRQGLELVDVERLPVHGGSLRVFVGRSGTPSGAVERLLEEEREAGVDDQAYYADFAKRVETLRGELVRLLHELKGAGHDIAAYGASAKGATLLNFCGLTGETIDFVADRSTLKQGYFTPGSHLPILAPEALLERQPAYTLLLTWNFADEILLQQAEYRSRGGKFVVPVPFPEIV